MKQTILVTGATGYIGAWVAKGLLEKGHQVRITVRNKNNKEKYAFLEQIAEKTGGTLEVWEADLLKAGSFDKATSGCDSIAHIASPFQLNVKDAQKELVNPAVDGTSNVLEAANRSGSVKKIVLTSSVAAVYGDATDMKEQGLTTFTEDQFNTSSSLRHQPYSYSKVMAEKKAWEMEKAQSSWQLVVINPSFVMGPSLNPSMHSESQKFMNDILKGKFKTGTAELYFGFVDVRDVAKAHILALEKEATGRHILAERVTDMLSFSNIIGKLYPGQFKLPKSNNPKWLLSIIGGLFGLTRKFIKNNVGVPISLDNTKSKKSLGLNYTPLEKTVKDMVDQQKSL
jgi:nucleoside-diphosphate-sugar epimerase